MRGIHPGEIWTVDFGLAAKVRPALLLTGEPDDDELDLVTVLLHATVLRGNCRELDLPNPFLKPGALHLQQIQTVPTISGGRNSGNEAEALTRLRDWLAQEKLSRTGLPVYGYFDPPWTPGFLRRNEVMPRMESTK